MLKDQNAIANWAQNKTKLKGLKLRIRYKGIEIKMGVFHFKFGLGIRT